MLLTWENVTLKSRTPFYGLIPILNQTSASFCLLIQLPLCKSGRVTTLITGPQIFEPIASDAHLIGSGFDE